jgi:hypothetical protein
MKPILYLQFVGNPSKEEKKRIAKVLSDELGNDITTLMSYNAERNSAKILTGRSTRLKKHQIDKLLKL